MSKLPGDVLWDYLADYDNVVRLGWDDASAIRLGSSDACEARYKAHTVWEGMRNTYTACLERAERPNTLTWTTKSGGARSWVRFDLASDGERGTHVTATLHVKHGGGLRQLEPFAWGLLRSALVKTVSRLGQLDGEVTRAD